MLGNRRRRLFGLALGLTLAVVVSACGPFSRTPSAPGSSASTTTADTAKPTAVISQPANNAVFVGGAPVKIEVQANDESGRIATVEIRVNGAPLTTLQAAPFAVSWTPPSTGNFQIDAVARDSAGNTGDSLPIIVTIKQAKMVASVPAPKPTRIPKASDANPPPDGFWAAWGTAARSEASLSSTLQRIRASGFPTGVAFTPEWRNLNQDAWYVVFIGPYSTKADADQAALAARTMGYSGFYSKFSGQTTLGD